MPRKRRPSIPLLNHIHNILIYILTRYKCYLLSSESARAKPLTVHNICRLYLYRYQFLPVKDNSIQIKPKHCIYT